MVNFSSDNRIRDKRFATSLPEIADRMKCSRKIMKWNVEQKHILIDLVRGKRNNKICETKPEFIF